MKGFRVAEEASTARHVVATLLQSATFWSLFLWLLPELVAALGRELGVPPLGVGMARPFAIALFVAASSLGLISGITMAVRGRGTPLPLCTARELVLRGPYRWLRNPMALAGIVQGIAVGLWRDDVLVVHYALLGALLWHVAIRPAEERDLAARFGTSYVAYRHRVGLWLPTLPRWLDRACSLAGLLVAFRLMLRAEDAAARWRVSPAAAFALLLALLLVARRTRHAANDARASSPSA